MKPQFNLIIFLLLAPFMVCAQSNFKPGYVINAQNDTLKGLIDYREWIRNPKEITFKQTQTAAEQKFTPATSNGFGITNAEYYEKAVVKVSTSTVELSQLANYADTANITDTVFLYSLVKGKNLSLYQLTTAIKPIYYYKENTKGVIVPLKQYVYFNDEERAVAYINTFNRQLMVLAQTYQPGVAGLQSRVLKAGYMESDLIDIITRLNGGVKSQQNINVNSGLRAFLGAAVRQNRMAFSGTDGPFADGKADNAMAPVLTGGLDVLVNKHTERLVIRMELSASYAKHTFNAVTTSQFASYTTQNTLQFNQFMGSFTPQIMYSLYSTDKFKAFIDGGVALNFFAYNKYALTTTYSYGSSVTVNKTPSFESFAFSFPVKAGVQLNKRLEIYAAYAAPTSVTRYVFYSVDLSHAQAGINYLFK